ncbi:hypothetical protein HanRHA438_Chr04g0178991 [Helianthus annuus]|nr:hypothetical protein HanHA300_Chr04g0138711 [Helianthus annuus]KAJ0597191.1 hypothetical protein HanHA89_Chr04g0151671 [Helianthus annuus]KAJ0761539.1 hypothetical protein HanOQP8_Chr04g0151001 [Helianthus annuus]KAJ0927113.1 hypothetical protein HanRHA438_Chr04g0178991 [Helianthus annuus]
MYIEASGEPSDKNVGCFTLGATRNMHLSINKTFWTCNNSWYKNDYYQNFRHFFNLPNRQRHNFLWLKNLKQLHQKGMHTKYFLQETIRIWSLCFVFLWVLCRMVLKCLRPLPAYASTLSMRCSYFTGVLHTLSAATRRDTS